MFDVQNVEVAEETKPTTVSTLFGALTSDIMTELGAPQDLIPFLKSIPDKKTFNDNKDKLPSDVYENFSWIAEGSLNIALHGSYTCYKGGRGRSKSDPKYWITRVLIVPPGAFRASSINFSFIM